MKSCGLPGRLLTDTRGKRLAEGPARKPCASPIPRKERRQPHVSRGKQQNERDRLTDQYDTSDEVLLRSNGIATIPLTVLAHEHNRGRGWTSFESCSRPMRSGRARVILMARVHVLCGIDLKTASDGKASGRPTERSHHQRRRKSRRPSCSTGKRPRRINGDAAATAWQGARLESAHGKAPSSPRRSSNAESFPNPAHLFLPR